MKLDELLKKHPLYEKNISHWDFLKDSYDGGEAYKDAELLYQYAFERLDKEAGDTLYQERLEQTPLDNQCKTAIHTYSSYLWRKPPQRDLGKLLGHAETEALLKDCDRCGTELNEFMRQVQIHGHIYGHTWVIVDKPSKAYANKKKAREAGSRPYLVRYDPPAVWNWEFNRLENGAHQLGYLKLCEETHTKEGVLVQKIRIWTLDTIEEYELLDGKLTNENGVTVPNNCAEIPAVCHYSRTRRTAGIGVSEIEDVAFMQRSIYNTLSEQSQTIRNANHDTLVKNEDDKVSAGAGGVIIMAEDTEAQKKPYLLSRQMFVLQGIINTIKQQQDMIDTMTHLSPVRTQRTQPISGEAIKQEFQLLNALLNEMSAQLEMTEQRIFRIFCDWIDKEQAFETVKIVYPAQFELRDTTSQINLLQTVKKLGVQSVTFRKMIDKQIARIALEDDVELETIFKEIDAADYSKDPAATPTTTPTS